MNRIAIRDTIFWVLWVFNAFAVISAVSATGYTQALSEGYLTVLGIAESFFIFSLSLVEMLGRESQLILIADVPQELRN